MINLRFALRLLVKTPFVTVVAIGAGLVPAYRASRVEPTTALRYE